MNKERLLKRFCLQQGCHWLVIGIMIPILVLMFQSIGMSLQQVGIIMAVYVGATALLEIPLGGIADRFGRMHTYQCSLLVNIVGFGTLYFATDFSSLLVAAALLGAARAIYSGTLDAWFYDAFSKAQSRNSSELTYHHALARVNVSLTIGLAIGSLIGGFLPSTGLAEQFPSPYQLPVVITLLGNAVMLAVTYLLLGKLYSSAGNKQQPKSAPTSISDTIKHALHHARTHDVIAKLLFTILGCGIVLSSVENFWQPYLAPIAQNAGYGTTLFGIVTALYFAMSAVSSLASIPILRVFKQSHTQLMLSSRVLAALALISLGYSEQPMAFIVVYLLFFFFFTVGNNSEQVLLNDNTPEQFRSTMLSVSSLAVTTGAIGSSLVFGYVSEHYSITLNWVICGAILALTSLAFVPMGRHIQRVATELK